MSTTEGSADTESYVQRNTRKREIDTSLGVRAHLTNANVAVIEERLTEELPTPVPVLTEDEIAENYRRLSAPVNVIEWTGSDGLVYREYHDTKVPGGESDGRLSTMRVDRGTGTRDSLKLLSKEGAVKADRLLPSKPGRDASGRFVKGA